MEHVSQPLGDAIYNYRVRHDLSQGQFAELCGLCTQTVNSIENGLQNPSKLTRGKIELLISKDEKEENKHDQNEE